MMRKTLQKFSRSMAVIGIALSSFAPLAHAAWPKAGDVLVLTASFDSTGRHEYLYAVDPVTKVQTLITDFSTFTDPELNPYAYPNRVAAAPDGTIWVTYPDLSTYNQRRGGGVVRLNPDGTHVVTTVFSQNLYPSGIAIGANGAVYVVTNNNTFAGLFRVDTNPGSPEPLVLNTSAVDPDCNPNVTFCPQISFQDAIGLSVDGNGTIYVGDVAGGAFSLSTGTVCQQEADCGALYRIVPGSEFVVTDSTSQYFGQTVISATKTLISDFNNPAQGRIGDSAGFNVALASDGTFLVTDSSFYFTYGLPTDPCHTATAPAECFVYGGLFRVQPNGTRIVLSDFGDSTQGQSGAGVSIVLPIPLAILADETILMADCDGVSASRAICTVDPTSGFRTLWSDFGGTAQINGTSVQLRGVDALAVVPVLHPTATTTLTASPNPSIYGQTVTLTAQVTSNTGATPTGSVTFQDGGSPLGTATLSGGGASLTLATLTAGTHSITAAYSGDASFMSSVSASVMQEVDRASTATMLVSSLNPSPSGAPVTFTATVTPTSGSGPTGTVTFYDSGASVGSAIVSAGSATLTLNTLANGNHSVTAVYSGDTNFNGSTSVALNEAVGAMTDFAITLAATPPSVTRTTNTTLNIVVSNNGPLDGTSVVARLFLPAGLTFVSANPAASYAPATGLWAIGHLASGASTTLQVVATLNATSVSVTSTIVSADQADGNLANNTATITINEAAINVGGTCDLRNAIIAANTDAPSGGCPAGVPGLDVIYLPANSTIEYPDVFETPAGIGADELPAVTSPIMIEGRGSVVGPSSAAGTPAMRVFYVAKGGALTLHNLMVRNGTGAGAGGGVLLQGAGASVVVDASQIIGNFANFGGGIASGIAGSGDHGDIVIRNSSLIAANTAFFGGGVAAGAGLTITTNSTVGSGNIAGINYGGNLAFSDAGGIYTVGNASISNSFIHDNTANTKGGGIVNDGIATIDTAQIYNNKSTVAGAESGLGAGLLTGRFGTTTVTNSRIFTNTGIDGGGVWNSHVTTLTDTDIFENHAQTGGGIENAGLLNLVRGSINQNSADFQGGGIANLLVNDLGTTAALNVDSTPITNNTTKQVGGAIASSGPATLTNVTLSGNHSDLFIGGISVFSGSSMTLTGSTIRANSAVAGFGGMFVYSGASADIRNSVIAANTSGAAGGGLGVSGFVTLTDTTVGGPTVPDGNIAGTTGGGILVASGGLLGMAGGAVQNNVANGALVDGGGGGLANLPGLPTGFMYLADVTISNNRAPNAAGGGLYLGGTDGTFLTLSGGILTGNSAYEGGGLAVGNDAVGYGSIFVSGTAISNNVATTGPGGAAYVGGRLFMQGGSMTGNTSPSAGGAVFVRSGSLQLTNVTVDSNTAGTYGGGVYCSFACGDLRINGGAIRNSRAVSGGGIFSFAGTFLVNQGAIIESNTATQSAATLGGGGGIYVTAGQLTLSGATVRNNAAPNANGGGIYSLASSVIDDSSVAGNSALSAAGIYTKQGSLTIKNNSFIEQNFTAGFAQGGDSGGGISLVSSTLDLSDSTVRNNFAPISGGGLLVNGGSGTIRRATISGNQAQFSGLVAVSGATLDVAQSTFTGNYANNTSGVTADTGSTVTISNSTISGNLGAYAVHAYKSAVIRLSSSTVVNNTPSGSAPLTVAAITAEAGANIAVDNTIVAANIRYGGVFADCSGPVTSNGHNLFGAGTGCSQSATDFTVNPDTVFTSVLAPLANNGGPTLTHALLPGSPALDNGAPVGAGVPPACFPTDQRGLPRPQDATGFGARCDIGAFEQQTLLIAPLRLDSTTPSSARSGIGALTITAAGIGFVPGSVLNWNGTPLPTTVFNQSSMSATVPASDLALPGDLNVILITVVNPDGTVSNPQAFTVFTSNVTATVSGVVAPGATAGPFGIVPGGPGSVGISVTYTNNTAGSSAAVVTIADYKNNPVGATVFDIGGKFADLRVSGADPTDTMTANFYYPTSIAGAAELSLQLTYWNGATWAPVLSSGGVPPVKNTTNNLDGTTSGGRFTVIFDDTSTPKLTDLHGTVFMIAPSEAALEFDPKTRDVVVLDRFGTAASMTSTPTTWGRDDDPSSDESGPAELRTYVLGSDPSTSVTMVVQVKRAGHEIKARVISVQYGRDPAVTEPENLLSVEWADRPAGTIKELEQKLTIGSGSDRQDVNAKFDAAKNQTTIGDANAQPRHIIEPGLVLLRAVTNANTIVADYAK